MDKPRLIFDASEGQCNLDATLSATIHSDALSKAVEFLSDQAAAERKKHSIIDGTLPPVENIHDYLKAVYDASRLTPPRA